MALPIAGATHGIEVWEMGFDPKGPGPPPFSTRSMRRLAGDVAHQRETVLKRVCVQHLPLAVHQLLGQRNAEAHDRTAGHLSQG